MYQESEPRAIVLAAGDGTRLRPLTTANSGAVVPKQFRSLRRSKACAQENTLSASEKRDKGGSLSAKATNEVAGKMGTTGHDMGNGFAIVFISRAVALEKYIEPLDALGHSIDRLQSDRDPIVCEGKLYPGNIGLATKVALLHPHP